MYQKGHVKMLKTMIENGYSFDRRYEDTRSLLGHAALAKNPDVSVVTVMT